MGPDFLIALAIPFFFLLIGLELWAARRRGRKVYRFADALADMGCGIIQQAGTLFLGVLVLGAYAFVYDRFRLLHFAPGSAVPWVLALVGVDFAYYWWHRLSHTINVLWAIHGVHHQSEDYNLAVALRQAILSGLTTLPFYLPLALLGVPPLVMATSGALNTLYQFWIHTELVGKLGAAERVLNTPSHHRVHHAINPRYLDKNFAGVLITWDRLFGTFEEEGEAARYGITTPLRSFNPLWAQVAGWVELARQSRATPRLADKLRVWFAPPAWHPPGVEVPPPPTATPGYRKYDPEPPAGIRWYVGAHFALESAGIFSLLLWQAQLSRPVLAIAAALLVLSLVCGAGLLEHRAWAPAVEVARLMLLSTFGLAMLWEGPWRYVALGAAAALGTGALLAHRAWRTAEPMAAPLA